MANLLADRERYDKGGTLSLHFSGRVDLDVMPDRSAAGAVKHGRCGTPFAAARRCGANGCPLTR